MGLFDTLICKYPLPGNPPDVADWQTKSLGCTLDSYTISPEGRLLQHRPRFWDEESYGPHPGASLHDEEFEGPVRFYTMTPDRAWWEYEAWFRGGVIRDIRIVAAGRPVGPPGHKENE